MLNFNRSARHGDAKTTDRVPLKPAVSSSAYPLASLGGTAGRVPATSSSVVHEPAPPHAPHAPSPAVAHEPPSLAVPPSAAAAARSTPPAGRAIGPETPGSKLFVGPNIKLNGVEISDCDVLVVEGQVEATVHSKAMLIAKPGTLKGVAVIDVAEVDGTFTGELTVQTRLVVNSTGRVSGTIRYGSLVVAEGGELIGDIKRIDPTQASKETARPLKPDARALQSPEQASLS